MTTLLFDTTPILALLMTKESPYINLAKAIDNEKINAVISVVTLTELINLLGKDTYKEKIKELLSLKMDIVDTDRRIAIRAGELHMKQKLFTGDALIAATGIIENIKHVVTEDHHFDAVEHFIKPINLKTALNMAR